MGLVNAIYNWRTVKAVYITFSSMNLVGPLVIALTILWAIRFERGFGDYLNLVSPGNGHTWTAVIISAAICCSPAYILGIKSWLYLKLESNKSDFVDQSKVDESVVDPHVVNRLLLLHVIACLLSGCLVAILNVTYLLFLSDFQQKSRDSLIEAIEKYSSDIAVKSRIDAIQTELECCGDSGYEDWFHVPWLKLSMEGSEDVENGPLLEGQSATEKREEASPPVDVPFSCCSNDIPKPCVHHDILSPSAVYDYKPKHLTITTRGCRANIISKCEVIRIFLGGYLTFLSVYQFVLSIVSRLLQTAHSNELYIGPEKSRYHAWIFFQLKDFERSKKENQYSRLRKTETKRKGSLLTNAGEGDMYIVRCGNRRDSRSNRKVLTKLRSRITTKSKSLSTIRPTFLRSNFRSKKKNAIKSESEIDDDEGVNSEERRLISNIQTKSEIFVKQNCPSIFSLVSSDSLVTNLPPPPPPPAFTMTLNIESDKEKNNIQCDPHIMSKTETNIKDAFNQTVSESKNSGRRIKVLERFGKIWDRDYSIVQQRESGGGNEHSLRSSCSKKKMYTALSSSDVYNRFRGTLQHTLARREAIRTRRAWDVYNKKFQNNLNVKKANPLARIRCNNIPPSYCLLAKIEVTKQQSNIQTDSMLSYASPLPSRSLSSIHKNLPLYCSERIHETKTHIREQQQCTACKRPVLQSSSSSCEFLAEKITN